MSSDIVYDYTIYMGTQLDTAHHRLNYTVILHRTDDRCCSLFTTELDKSKTKTKTASGKPEFKLCAPTYRGILKAYNKAADNFPEWTPIGYLRHEDVSIFLGSFLECTPAQESRVTVFSWLWVLVDLGLLDADEVESVQPKPEAEH